MSPRRDVLPHLVTLTTDFGTADGYVGAVKGRLLSLAPGVTLCDISHEIAPQNIVQGAWCLRRAAREFPRGTVHLAVVDPGVGSGRPALVLETERFLLVGPDNGLLSLAVREADFRSAVHLEENPPHWGSSGSFDGLTLFAPVAARLARGALPGSLGPSATTWVQLPAPEPVYQENGFHGEVLFFDRFGNAITNITRDHLAAIHGEAKPGDGAGFARILLEEVGEAQWVTHYAALAEPPGRIAAIWNSDGHLELALHGGNLKSERAIRAGQRVVAMRSV